MDIIIIIYHYSNWLDIYIYILRFSATYDIPYSRIRVSMGENVSSAHIYTVAQYCERRKLSSCGSANNNIIMLISHTPIFLFSSRIPNYRSIWNSTANNDAAPVCVCAGMKFALVILCRSVLAYYDMNLLNSPETINRVLWCMQRKTLFQK